MSNPERQIVALAIKREEIEKLLDEFQRTKKRYEELPTEILKAFAVFTELADKCETNAALGNSIELVQRIQKISASFGTNRASNVV